MPQPQFENFNQERSVAELIDAKKFDDAFKLLVPNESTSDQQILMMISERRLLYPASSFILLFGLHHSRQFSSVDLEPAVLLDDIKIFMDEKRYFLAAAYAGYLATTIDNIEIPLLIIKLTLDRKLEPHRPDQRECSANVSAFMLLKNLLEEKYPDIKKIYKNKPVDWLAATKKYMYEEVTNITHNEMHCLLITIDKLNNQFKTSQVFRNNQSCTLRFNSNQHMESTEAQTHTNNKRPY